MLCKIKVGPLRPKIHFHFLSWSEPRSEIIFFRNIGYLPLLACGHDVGSPPCKLGSLFSLPAETVSHIWLLSRLSANSCFVPRLLSVKNCFLPRQSAWLCFLLGVSTGRRVTQTDSAGSHLSGIIVSARSKRSQNSQQKPNTVGRQWLEHFWTYENMFETGVVGAMRVNHGAMPEGIIGIYFRFSLI